MADEVTALEPNDDKPRRGSHPALLISLAAGLIVLGLVLWILGYLEQGAANGDRLADLGAGILTGGAVSLAGWFVSQAASERDRKRGLFERERHHEVMEHLKNQDADRPTTTTRADS